ncbi:Do family serine endopeptidase [Paraurantiacibacter namhicola]|uniref:Do family serine endopeptidase n=1 Tax=Paraurantiacibacter namhicola TaxID=645517 RepID=UPI000833D81E|nr:Do family serine endopeptidase [Paraurantiacibacter namhicola]
MRYSYSITSALLAGGAALTLMTGYPAGAQEAQNAQGQITPVAGAPASFADLTEQLQPAVVNIFTRQRIEVQGMGTPFFGQQGPATREGQSLGSGFIISADGYVVTNNHVVTADGRGTVESITVRMPDGTEYEAELVGADAQSDLAVLKIDAGKSLPFVRFGDSDSVRAGDWVIAIGNPFGLGGTVTSGIVSAVLRNTGGGAYDRFLQTDASINRGNSGGPLFDMHGNVVGINNAIISPTGGSVGIGFAIPAGTAQPIVQKLIAGEEILRGYLGVRIQPVTEDFADALGIEKDRGEFIQMVQPGEAADKAGLKAGDVVLSVNGEAVTPDQTLSFLVANIEPGTRIPLEILRDGDRRTLQATVGRRPTDEQLAQQNFNPEEDGEQDMPQESGEFLANTLGVRAMTLTPQFASQLGLPTDTKGVVVAQVDPSSDAARKQVRRGTVIYSVNGRSVGSVEDLEEAVRDAQGRGREAVLLRMRDRSGPTFSQAVRLR